MYQAMTLGPLSENPSGSAYPVSQSRPGGWWRGRWLVAECVSALFAVSVALAYANPPDPSWISGIYDDRDRDDLVAMVTDGAGVNDAQAPEFVKCLLTGFLPRAVTWRIPNQTPHRQQIRGPPLPASNVSAHPLPISAPNALPRSSTPLILVADLPSPSEQHRPLATEEPTQNAGPPPASRRG